MILFSIISYLLEINLKYYFPYLVPMFFISFLIIYIISKKDKKSIYYVLGSCLIYDLFFGNVIFLYTIIFIYLYYLITFISNKIHKYLLTDILLFIVSLILFIIMKSLILSLVGYHYSITFLLNQILNSIVINLIYGLIIYYFLGIKRRKA